MLLDLKSENLPKSMLVNRFPFKSGGDKPTFWAYCRIFCNMHVGIYFVLHNKYGIDINIQAGRVVH